MVCRSLAFHALHALLLLLALGGSPMQAEPGVTQPDRQGRRFYLSIGAVFRDEVAPCALHHALFTTHVHSN
jgi:hypothetical protein